MKIFTVCGFGLGSSMVLKMSTEKALKKLNLNAEVENTDITAAKFADCDLILTGKEFAEEFEQGVKTPVYAVHNFLDVEEIENILKKRLEE